MHANRLFDYGRYYVAITNDHYEDAGDGVRQCKGYGVFNKETGIMETSSTLLFHAVKWTKICELSLTEVSNKSIEQDKKELTWPEAVEAAPQRPN